MSDGGSAPWAQDAKERARARLLPGGLLAAIVAWGAACSSSSAAAPPPAEAGPPDAGDAGVEASISEAGDASIPSCAAYCSLVNQACTGAAAQYIDDASCMAICAVFAPGAAGDTSGDSLACRASHAMQASGGSVDCAAAGPLGGGVCGADPCAAFCELDLAFCTGAQAAYGDAGACAGACAAFPGQEDAGVGAMNGNTLSCRLYYLERSSTGPVAAVNYCHDTAATSSLCSPDGG